jgi:hypothetical protein
MGLPNDPNTEDAQRLRPTRSSEKCHNDPSRDQNNPACEIHGSSLNLQETSQYQEGSYATTDNIRRRDVRSWHFSAVPNDQTNVYCLEVSIELHFVRISIQLNCRMCSINLPNTQIEAADEFILLECLRVISRKHDLSMHEHIPPISNPDCLSKILLRHQHGQPELLLEI